MKKVLSADSLMVFVSNGINIVGGLFGDAAVGEFADQAAEE